MIDVVITLIGGILESDIIRSFVPLDLLTKPNTFYRYCPNPSLCKSNEFSEKELKDLVQNILSK